MAYLDFDRDFATTDEKCPKCGCSDNPISLTEKHGSIGNGLIATIEYLECPNCKYTAGRFL